MRSSLVVLAPKLPDHNLRIDSIIVPPRARGGIHGRAAERGDLKRH